MTTAATRERHAFCDTLAEVGPDARTLCEGWTTRDLAAHVVLRERRPDAALGLLVSRLGGHTAKVQERIASDDWNALVEQIRGGPPRFSPTRLSTVDRLANTVEFFVHHEDVRRQRGSWDERELHGDLATDLHTALRRGARLLLRKAPAGVVLEPDGGDPIVANDAEPKVTVSGPIGEVVMFVYGRQTHAKVTVSGPDDAVAAVFDARFGI